MNLVRNWPAESDVSRSGVAKVFGARGADFRLAPPPLERTPSPPPPPPTRPSKNCNSPKFAKSHKLFTKFGYLKQIKFVVGRFLVVGDHLDPTFPYICGRSICFCQFGGAKTLINNDFLRNRLKLFYKTVTVCYLLAALAPPSTRCPGRFPSYAPGKSLDWLATSRGTGRRQLEGLAGNKYTYYNMSLDWLATSRGTGGRRFARLAGNETKY